MSKPVFKVSQLIDQKGGMDHNGRQRPKDYMREITNTRSNPYKQ
jgi:hypothetical protein